MGDLLHKTNGRPLFLVFVCFSALPSHCLFFNCLFVLFERLFVLFV